MLQACVVSFGAYLNGYKKKMNIFFSECAQQIPGFVGTESSSPTNHNPFQLPDAYLTSQLEMVRTVHLM